MERVRDRNEVTQQLFQDTGITPAEEQILQLIVQDQNSWPEATLNFYSPKIFEIALSKHAKALIDAGEASERHAASLTKATWILAAATIALVFATIALWLKPGP